MSVNQALAAVSRINMQPALIEPATISDTVSAIREFSRADVDVQIQREKHARAELASAYGFTSDIAEKPFLFADGVAVIPIHGLLINRFGRSWGFITGYNFIRAQMSAAEADDDVKGIVFDINSFGGEVAGCFELAEEMAALTKPTAGVVDSAAYSAGYALASACKQVILLPSGGVGSIGAICVHVSFEKLLENEGIKVELIYSGAHKADGNPYKDLPEAVRADTKSRVDATRQKFAALVAKNRGADLQAILDTEARCYRAEEAKALGLIDAVETPAKALTVFINELSGSTTEEEKSMATANATPGAENSNAQPTTPAVNAPANGQDVAAARQEERTRMSAILNCDEAAGKQKLATTLATTTSLTVEEAKGILAAAGPESAPVASASVANTTSAADPEPNAFAAAMNSTANPTVGADAATGAGDGSGEMGMAQQILRDQQLATGTKLI